MAAGGTLEDRPVYVELHDDLDEAVTKAYGWPASLSDGNIRERLVALNAERAAEEAQGQTRWLRSKYQNPEGAAQQVGIVLKTSEAAMVIGVRQPSENPGRAGEHHAWGGWISPAGLERGLSSQEIKVILENLIQGVLPPWVPKDYRG